MENNKKPDWFELADNDKPAKRSIKPAKSTLAVVATLALTTLAGWGFVSNDESKAIASENNGQIQVDDLATTSSASSETTAPVTSTVSSQPTTSASAAPTSSTITAPNPSTAQNDTILPPTSKGGDGDHEKGEGRHKEKHDGTKEANPDFNKSDNHDSGNDD
jgi:hypothetical protein